MTTSRHCRSPISAATRAESDRLRPLFLRWVGNRSVRSICAVQGLPYSAFTGWMGGRHLPPRHLAQVRALISGPNPQVTSGPQAPLSPVDGRQSEDA